MIIINFVSLKKKFLIAFLLGAISTTATTNSFAITKTTAKVGSIVIGASTGIATYMIISRGDRLFSGDLLGYVLLDLIARQILSITTGAVVGERTWWYSSKWLHSLTPEGQFDLAQELFSSIELEPIINADFQSAEDLSNQIQVKFGSSKSPQEIKKYLMSCSQILSKVTTILDSAEKETHLDSDLITLVDQIETLRKKAIILAEAIEQKLTTMKTIL